MTMLAAEQKRYGDTAPLTVDTPIPAQLVIPKTAKKKYRGGLAPGKP